MIYICNRFSLAMLPAWRLVDGTYSDGYPHSVQTSILVETVSDPKEWLREAEIRQGQALSLVSQNNVASLFSLILGREIPVHRLALEMEDGDELLVGQYVGPRPEDTFAELQVESSKYRWLRVCID